MDLPDKIRIACIALGLGFAAMACAAPAIPDESQDLDDTESGSTTKKNNKNGSSSSSSSGGSKLPPKGGDTGEDEEGEPPPKEGDTTTPPATSCTSSASYEACYQCCDPTKAVEPAIDAFGLCACQNPGTCAAQCGNNYCSGQQPTAACEQCLNAATACEAKADAACGAACKAAIACVDTSKCDDKP
jgi:hypothetical protein